MQSNSQSRSSPSFLQALISRAARRANNREDEYSLKYCHKPEEGLPKLSEFITLATDIKSSLESTTQPA